MATPETNPHKLRTIIESIWADLQLVIKSHLLRTDRAFRSVLFVHLYLHLQAYLPGHSVLMQPQFVTASGKDLEPDLLVLSGNEVLAILQVKYDSRTDPVHDLNLLVKLGGAGGRKLSRYRCNLDDDLPSEVTIAPDCLLAAFRVLTSAQGRQYCLRLYEQMSPLAERFLGLCAQVESPDN